MRSSAHTTPAFALLFLALSGLFAGWTGCSASGSTNVTGGLGGSGNGGSGVSTGPGPATGATTATGTSTSTGGTGAKDGGPEKDGGDSGTCGASEKECDGKCVAADDPAYGCTPTGCTPCAGKFPNAMQACQQGACTLGACNTGFSNCDGMASNGCETNTGTDPANCGACGAPCVVPNATASCTGGKCAIATCTSGWTDCNGMAVDGCEANLQNDPMNCGSCGMQCTGMETCQAGMCGLACPKGTANCPGDPTGQCDTTLGTNKNCAFCSDACNLANSNSQCMMMNGNEVCSLVACNTGFANCDMIAANGCETNSQTDANNCGSCGNVCPSGPNSTAVCNGSTCGLNCDPGFLDCDGNPTNGCEVNGNTDLNNCGTCGDVCNTPNATPGCSSGICVIATCNGGFADCDMKPSDGCEINTTTDPKNCGTCGTLCSEANGSAVCNSGTCGLGPCNPGFLNCDGKYASGCNVNSNTDTNNCGGCNNVCNLANSTSTCSAGACAISSCNTGFADCDKMPGDGCETNIKTSTSNCGACGNACSTPNASPSCSNGTCGIGACNTGFANCDVLVSDGCEVNTQNDPNNCGGCGVKCNLANANAGCTNGVCTVVSCNPGFADCDNDASNGCETSTGTDPNNCGGCGTKCNLTDAVAGCAGGTCTVASCVSGFQDCDHIASNGCEINTNTNTLNCGGCGHQCFTANGTPGCSGGSCTTASCTPPFKDCDGNVANGCEDNTSTDNNNCGTCGNSCVAACGGAGDHVVGTQCVGSTCGILAGGCAPGYQDFDGKCADGCECLDSTTQGTCTTAFSLFAGALTPGNSITPFSSSMAPLSVTQAFFTLTFGSNTSPSYHPLINLSSPGNEFLMDITQDCSGTAVQDVQCSDNGANNSKGVVSWEVAFTNNNVPGMDYYNPIPAVGNGGTVWVRIYRNPAVTPTCNQYTLTASD